MGSGVPVARYRSAIVPELCRYLAVTGRADIARYDYIDAMRGMAIIMHSSQSIAPPDATLQSLMDEGARGIQLPVIIIGMFGYLILRERFPAARGTEPPGRQRTVYCVCGTFGKLAHTISG